MFWFDKENPDVLFADNREVRTTLCDGRELLIKPDINMDFRNMPFDDETFKIVVFDPPHLIQGGDNSWMVKKYGKLNKNTWKQVLHDGFSECMRVLKPYGTLIFKWNEVQIPVKDVIAAIGVEPLYGNRSGKQGKTHWMAFIKTEEVK